MSSINCANGILNPAAFRCPPPPNFSAIAATIETLAAAELLTAHKNAVTLRVNALKEQA